MATPAHSAANADQTSPVLKKIGMGVGAGLFLLTFLVPSPEGMSQPAWHVCGLALWMAVWWITEALPLPVTALLPLVVLPLMNIMPLRKASGGFAADIIFLFLGGFVLSIAIQKWRVHERLGLGLLRYAGWNLGSLLAGLLLVTAFMGMWMSNTATAMVMMPMAVSIAALISQGSAATPSSTKALVLAVAYAPCLGGLATFIGTPTNAVLEGYVAKTYGVNLSLAQWMAFGVPVALLLLGCCWLLLYFSLLRRAPAVPGLSRMMADEYRKIGRFTAGEVVTTAVFAFCVVGWVFSDTWSALIGAPIDDAVIAIVGALLLFITPLDRRLQTSVLTWKDAEKLPWGILIFFGGSLSLSAALTETGVTRWLSDALQIMHGVPVWLVVVGVVVIITAVSEMMSNSATITAFLPILAGLAGGLGVHPFLVMIPATLAASCAFMMPGASPNNAIAFSTGTLSVGDMVRQGLRLNLVCAAVIVLAAFYLIPAIKDFDPLTPPAWARPAQP
ncbi:SLC13 family permease [Horticoccus sp. 23ND18S-11]|uniref:SLC13 family permease n=1 Tax=Horticoccus sp. 23ND18S-11 TaxID=3391832 RepID=UPI0039C8F607